MSDEPATPFTFRPAPAKPSRKTTLEKVEHVPEIDSKESFATQEAATVEPAKRKRRTRAEIDASGGLVLGQVQDEMIALKACLKILRSLDGQVRARVLFLLKAVFE